MFCVNFYSLVQTSEDNLQSCHLCSSEQRLGDQNKMAELISLSFDLSLDSAQPSYSFSEGEKVRR